MTVVEHEIKRHKSLVEDLSKKKKNCILNSSIDIASYTLDTISIDPF